MYTEDIVAVAKRENNTKRGYLVVNKHQGKHIPVAPDKALGMFRALADLVGRRYQGEQLLLIGFAETATAIGEALAIQLGADYMQTTRENIPGVEYLHFSESHSHATEQKVVKDDIDAAAGRVRRIVFVEDEVTTGNTIWKLICLLRQGYGEKFCFSVASLLNGMDAAAQERYQAAQVGMVYLVKTDHGRYQELAAQYQNNGKYWEQLPPCPALPKVQEIKVSAYMNARRLHKAADYHNACERLWQEIKGKVPFGTGEGILVLGTEEFMYAPLYVARKIQELGNRVKFHATTRSPIMVSKDPRYPLHERYGLASLYENGRATYVYDLASYQMVLVVTDAAPGEGKGEASLKNALCHCGSQNIYFVRWCECEDFV